jgi:tyrosine-protein kinase Etk/Wzc
LNECLDAVYHRRWWIAAGVSVALAGAWLLAGILPKSYEAAAAIEVTGIAVSDAVRGLRAVPWPQATADEFHLSEADRRGLSIDQIPGAPAVRIAFRCGDPHAAAAIANSITGSYVNSLEPARRRGAAGRQLAAEREKMDSSGAALRQFQQQTGIADPESRLNELTARLFELDRDFAQIQAARAAKQAQSQRFPPGSVEAAEAVRELELIGQREARLSESYRRTKAEADALPARAVEYQRLRQRAEADSALYLELSRAVGAPPAPVRIVRAALPVFRPVSPNPALILAIALLSSLFAGCVAAVAVDRRGGIVRGASWLESRSGFDSVAVLPLVDGWHGLQGPAMFSTETRQGASDDTGIHGFREKIEALRHGLEQMQAGVITVVSPAAGEGRTRIAAELAASFASHGRATLLVDANLRAPVLHALRFSASPRIGLCSALAGETPWRECVMRASEPGTPDILPCGAREPGCVTLLHERLRALIDEASAAYEVVILDSPPFLSNLESLDIAHNSDVAILVARARVTSTREFEATLSYLHRLGTRVGAVVLNEA